MCKHKDSVEHIVNSQLSGYLGTKESAFCCETQVANVALDLHYAWALDTKIATRTLTGKRSIGTLMQGKAEVEKLAKAYVDQIDTGGHKTHHQALLNYVTGSNKLKAVWQGSVGLGKDDRLLSYITTCGTCSGMGQYRCTGCHGSGQQRCSFCNGSNRQTCNGCHGRGQYTSGNTTQNCGACYGSGHTTCGHCRHSGYDTCVVCAGSGTEVCSPCGATGYFTHEVSFDVRGVRATKVLWNEANTDKRINNYLETALKHGCPWVPLEETILVKPEDIKHDTEVEYPVKMYAAGDLQAVLAHVELGASRAECEFYGEGMVPLTLGQIGEKEAGRLASNVRKGCKQPEQLTELLGHGIYDKLLAQRKNDKQDHKGLYPVRTRLISAEASEALLQAYKRVVTDFKEQRSSQSYLGWLLSSLPWVLMFLGIVTFANAFYFGQLSWDRTGLPALADAVYELTQFWDHFFGYNFEQRSITFAGSGVVAYTIGRLFFMTERVRGFWRFLWEFFLCGNIGLFLVFFLSYNVFYVVNESLIAQAPGLNEVIASLVMSLQLVPEALIIGLTLGLLRCRRKQDVQAKKVVDRVAVSALAEDLGYQK